MNRLWRSLVLIIGIVCVISGCAFTTEGKISRQLELGQKYLLEEDYEQAIIAFNKVIELDAKQIEAYEGLIDVYVAQDAYDSAINTYLAGTEYTSGLAEEEQAGYAAYCGMLEWTLQDLADTANVLDERIRYMELLTRLVADNPDYAEELDSLYKEREHQQMIADFISNNQDALNYLLEQCETGDNETILEAYNSDEYAVIRNAYPDTETKIAIENMGKTLVLLRFTDITGDELYMYYGDVHNGVISGEGSLYVLSKENDGTPVRGSVYSGHWENDLPNGEGTYTHTYYNIDRHEEWDMAVVTISGNYIDALEDGAMTRVYEFTSRTLTFHYTATNGVVPAIGRTEHATHNHDIMAYSDEVGRRDRGHLGLDSVQGVEPYVDVHWTVGVG